MSQIKLVVFDMAGTTVKDKNEVQNCFLEAAAQTGLKAEAEQVNSMMGWSKKLVFQTLWQTQIGLKNPDYATKVETSFVKFKEILEHHYKTQPVSPTDGCLEIFSWLRSQNIKIALTTGFYREVTNIILNRLGWDKGLNSDYLGGENTIIQASITPTEIYHNEGRPAPYMIQKAMYKLEIKDPKNVIKIGDTPSDLGAGINANCFRVFGVTNGSHTETQLAEYSNDGLLKSISELKDKIANL
ncbi:MAG: HAD hydrolase-like protein [Microcoleaceae cyanobacterium MO_207.B10]|nr:HAD hydrolase-like protein [Microcoleaceae cyanobacterium MO_207.B10]